MGSENIESTAQYFPDIYEFEEFNDFSDEPPALSEWGLKKIAQLQIKLEQLQSIKDSKSYFGAKYNMHNFSRNELYGLANEVFGFNGWSTKISNYNINDVPSDDESRFSAICQVTVELFLKDGTFKDGSGVGEALNLPFKYQCYEKAKKEAVTDAIKNAILGLREVYYEYELKLEHN
ncbi:unnamed protein product [Candida verbasci]|uniref:DNA repair and recombination protein RAD52 n=1 Tax=Candida verbasci TaxID=1227364 RepID=A0A9W4XMF7_9ASCO|nr:unnamed protein product [Candida verbasci]